MDNKWLIMWHLLPLGLHIHADLLTGTLQISFRTTAPKTWNGPSVGPPSQTFCDMHNHQRHRLLSEPLSSSQLRHSGPSGTPSLSSAWRCTRTSPFPLRPSSWQWDQCLCSVAASAPHLRLASVGRMYLKHLTQPFMQHTVYGAADCTIYMNHLLIVRSSSTSWRESLWRTWSKRKYPGVSLPNLMIISACRVFPTNQRPCKGKKKKKKKKSRLLTELVTSIFKGTLR